MSSKSGIPSWQRAQAPSSPPSTTESGPQPGDVPVEEKPTSDAAPETQSEKSAEQDGTTLLAQAAKFLEDPAIRDAPRDKKSAFLQSKGVNAEDIEKLLSSQPEEKAVVPSEQKQGVSTAPTQVSTPLHLAIHHPRLTHTCRHPKLHKPHRLNPVKTFLPSLHIPNSSPSPSNPRPS